MKHVYTDEKIAAINIRARKAANYNANMRRSMRESLVIFACFIFLLAFIFAVGAAGYFFYPHNCK